MQRKLLISAGNRTWKCSHTLHLQSSPPSSPLLERGFVICRKRFPKHDRAVTASGTARWLSASSLTIGNPAARNVVQEHYGCCTVMHVFYSLIIAVLSNVPCAGPHAASGDNTTCKHWAIPYVKYANLSQPVDCSDVHMYVVNLMKWIAVVFGVNTTF